MKELENKFNIAFFEEFMNTVQSRGTDIALVQNGKNYSYGDLAQAAAQWQERFSFLNIIQGMVVGLKTDYSFESISLVLGLLKNKNIVALIPESIQDETSYIEDGQVQLIIRFSKNGKFRSEKLDAKVEHPLLKYLPRERGKGGFIIYSSGSTGKPKAIFA